LFISQLNHTIKDNEFVIEEFNGRFGNADVVKVKINYYDNSNLNQIQILKDYQCAKIIGYLHKNQYHNIKYLMDKTNYTYDNILAILNKLKKEAIISINKENNFSINKNFEYPSIEFISYELKLKNWKNAVIQANKNKMFSSLSYIAVPIELAKKIFQKEKDIFILYNVGLIGISCSNFEVFYNPKIEKTKTTKNPSYISSLAKFITNEKEQLN
jgi:hypothetical protein